MGKLTTITLAVVAAFALALAASPADAAAPDHETFDFTVDYIDSGLCEFPVAVHSEFTNMIVDSSLATGTGTLQLHQRDVETWTANGVELHVSGYYTIFVVFADGVALTATHVGLLEAITGSGGKHLFFRTGQAVYQVVRDPNTGFYVDGPLVTRHGVRDDFDATEICTALSG